VTTSSSSSLVVCNNNNNEIKKKETENCVQIKKEYKCAQVKKESEEKCKELFKQSDFIFDKSKHNSRSYLHQHQCKQQQLDTIKKADLIQTTKQQQHIASNNTIAAAAAATTTSVYARNSSHESRLQYQHLAATEQQQQQKRFGEIKMNFSHFNPSSSCDDSSFTTIDAKKSFAAFNSNGLQQQHHKQEAKFASQSNNMYLGGSATQLHSSFKTVSKQQNQQQQQLQHHQSATRLSRNQNFFIDSECCDALIQNIAHLHNAKQKQKERILNNNLSISSGALYNTGNSSNAITNSSINNVKRSYTDLTSLGKSSNNRNNKSKGESVEVVHYVDRSNQNGYYIDLGANKEDQSSSDDGIKRSYKIVYKKY
jgi:hypothetical protein